MLKKITLAFPIIFLPACFDTQKTDSTNSVKTTPMAKYQQGNITSIDQINDMQEFIDKQLAINNNPENILAIFDVDETLLTSYAEQNSIKKQIMAHDLFPHIANTILRKHTPTETARKIGPNNITIRNKQLNQYLSQQLINAATRKTYDIFAGLHKNKLLTAQAIEPQVGSLIDQLQNKGITVMGLTARGFDMKECTLEQLQNSGINLTKKTVYNEEHMLSDLHGFSNGFLFLTPGEENFDKGKLLIQLFEAIDYKPKHIIFIDDNLHFLEDVQNALAAKYPKITFDGLWYRYTPENEFDQELSEQLIHTQYGDSWWYLDRYYKQGTFSVVS